MTRRFKQASWQCQSCEQPEARLKAGTKELFGEFHAHKEWSRSTASFVSDSGRKGEVRIHERHFGTVAGCQARLG